ncbi:PREDICTED: CD109 antigen-like [Priapulus caudatus]|uniref:CD109 antigen-like n=1 Tax=Priapulus caudatus TaxID=37621 RepID=A0ABM1F610_PRICU|nr:PREDICTED: CD109 antigen-like [Priapulus caudatus]
MTMTVRDQGTESMKVKLDDAIRRGEKRLVSQLDVMADDPYSLAVTTYALVINNAPIHLQALSKLEALATEKGLRDLNGGCRHEWLIKQTELVLVDSSFQPSRADTVIGPATASPSTVLLLSAFSPRVPSRDLILSAIADDITRSFEVDSDNALVYQMAELPITDAVEVVPSGTGSALVQVKWSYNVKDEGPAAAFDLTSNVIHYSTGNVHVQVCSQYKKPGKSGMSVVTMNLPSGFVAERPLGQSHLVANVNADELQRPRAE